MACARAITTSWQVVASVTPHTTLWTPSTQTLSSMLGQKRGGQLRFAGPDIIEDSSGAGQLRAPLATSLRAEEKESGGKTGNSYSGCAQGNFCRAASLKERLLTDTQTLEYQLTDMIYW